MNFGIKNDTAVTGDRPLTQNAGGLEKTMVVEPAVTFASSR